MRDVAKAAGKSDVGDGVGRASGIRERTAHRLQPRFQNALREGLAGFRQQILDIAA